MSKKTRPETVPKSTPRPAGETPSPLQRSRGDVLFRSLAVLTLVLFAGSVCWNLWLVQKHLERDRKLSERDAKRDVEHMFWIITRSGATVEERTRAFTALVAAGNTEWRIAHLDSLQLKGVNLSGVSLKGAVFEACDLREARMSGANLFKIDFRLSKLSKVDLTGAVLSESNLFMVDLSNAKLDGAKLIKADLEQAVLRNASLRSCDLSEANLPMADFTGANLFEVNLTGTNLRDAKLIRANLHGVQFSQRPEGIRSVDFTDSNWWRARGLSESTIAECRKKFAPTKNAADLFRRDYLLWLKIKPSGQPTQ